ncbi:MAG: hypothetical protein LRZ85_08015 [Alphaproteobacteria bacterium]|nr:hypothetical protein [Alphaproteobacteria bacterium]MCD8570768.1 hypothetical protein [Alphaproteobacteria bacterium]
MDFFETVALDNQRKISAKFPGKYSLDVVIAKINEYGPLEHGGRTPLYMTANVVHVMQGNMAYGSTIKIYGGNGGLCRPYVTRFEKEKIYALALLQDKDGYYISSCGTYSMEIDKRESSIIGMVSESKNFFESFFSWIDSFF